MNPQSLTVSHLSLRLRSPPSSMHLIESPDGGAPESPCLSSNATWRGLLIPTRSSPRFVHRPRRELRYLTSTQPTHQINGCGSVIFNATIKVPMAKLAIYIAPPALVHFDVPPSGAWLPSPVRTMARCNSTLKSLKDPDPTDVKTDSVLDGATPISREVTRLRRPTTCHTSKKVNCDMPTTYSPDGKTRFDIDGVRDKGRDCADYRVEKLVTQDPAGARPVAGDSCSLPRLRVLTRSGRDRIAYSGRMSFIGLPVRLKRRLTTLGHSISVIRSGVHRAIRPSRENGLEAQGRMINQSAAWVNIPAFPRGMSISEFGAENGGLVKPSANLMDRDYLRHRNAMLFDTSCIATSSTQNHLQRVEQPGQLDMDGSNSLMFHFHSLQNQPTPPPSSSHPSLEYTSDYTNAGSANPLSVSPNASRLHAMVRSSGESLHRRPTPYDRDVTQVCATISGDPSLSEFGLRPDAKVAIRDDPGSIYDTASNSARTRTTMTTMAGTVWYDARSRLSSRATVCASTDEVSAEVNLDFPVSSSGMGAGEGSIVMESPTAGSPMIPTPSNTPVSITASANLALATRTSPASENDAIGGRTTPTQRGRTGVLATPLHPFSPRRPRFRAKTNIDQAVTGIVPTGTRPQTWSIDKQKISIKTDPCTASGFPSLSGFGSGD